MTSSRSIVPHFGANWPYQSLCNVFFSILVVDKFSKNEFIFKWENIGFRKVSFMFGLVSVGREFPLGNSAVVRQDANANAP